RALPALHSCPTRRSSDLTVSLESPDMYALDVASSILGSGDSSRLARKLRFQDKLVVSVSSGSHTPAGAPGWLQVTFQTEPKNVRSEEHTSELQSPCNLVC